MKCIEVIQLRASGRAERDRALNVCRQIIQSNNAEQPDGISLLKNTILNTDLWVCIYWDKRHDRYKKSLLGQQFEKGLAGFGLLNHSLLQADDILPPSHPGDNEKCKLQFDIQWLKQDQSTLKI